MFCLIYSRISAYHDWWMVASFPPHFWKMPCSRVIKLLVICTLHVCMCLGHGPGCTGLLSGLAFVLTCYCLILHSFWAIEPWLNHAAKTAQNPCFIFLVPSFLFSPLQFRRRENYRVFPSAVHAWNQNFAHKPNNKLQLNFLTRMSLGGTLIVLKFHKCRFRE